MLTNEQDIATWHPLTQAAVLATITVLTNEQGIATAIVELQRDIPLYTVAAAAQDVSMPAAIEIVGLDKPGAVAVVAPDAFVVVDVGFAALIRIDLTNESRTGILIAGPGQGTGVPLALGSSVCNDDVVALAVDRANDALLLIDCNHRRVLRVPLTPGERTVVPGCMDQECSTITGGTGNTPQNLRDLAVLPNGDIVAVDEALDAVLRINPNTGERSVLSGSGTSPDIPFREPIAVAVETDTTLVVLDTQFGGTVLRVRFSDGAREVVSSRDLSVGTGPSLQNGRDIAVANGPCPVAPGTESHCLFVLTSTAVVQVPPMTGQRTLLSGCQDMACQGRGPQLGQGRSVALESTGTFLVADFGLERCSVSLPIAATA